MSGPITQDLKTVVLHRKPTKAEAIRKGNVVTEKKYSAGTNKQGTTVANTIKVENEEISLPYSTADLGRAIQTARTAKNMKQSDLDKACNFPANTVRNYENGTAIVNQAQITKMERALGSGTKLPRPKPKKIVTDAT